MNPAIVLGMDINGLGVARALAPKNIPVMGITPHPEAIGSSSKYVIDTMLVRDNDGDLICQTIIDTAALAGSKPVVFPTTDRYIEFLLAYEKQLVEHVIYPFSPTHLFSKLIKKNEFYELMKEKGIAHPMTYDPGNDLDLLKAYVNELGYPCYIKPYHSLSIYKMLKIKGFYVHDRGSLKSTIKILNKLKTDVLVQEIIPGNLDQLYGTYFLNNNRGKTVIALSYRKLREWPPRFGAGTCIETVLKDGLFDTMKFAMERIGYCGVGDVEFKYDQRDDTFKIIDLNARTGQMNHFSNRIGFPFPLWAYQNAVGEMIDIPNTNNLTYPHMFGVRDVFDLLSIRKGNNHYSNMMREFAKTYLRWNWYSVVFDPYDLKPFFMYLMTIWKAMIT